MMFLRAPQTKQVNVPAGTDTWSVTDSTSHFAGRLLFGCGTPVDEPSAARRPEGVVVLDHRAIVDLLLLERHAFRSRPSQLQIVPSRSSSRIRYSARPPFDPP